MLRNIGRRKFVKDCSIVAIGTHFIPHFFNSPIKNIIMDNLTKKQYQPTDTTADILVDKLIAWDVDTIFTLVGDGH